MGYAIQVRLGIRAGGSYQCKSYFHTTSGSDLSEFYKWELLGNWKYSNLSVGQYLAK